MPRLSTFGGHLTATAAPATGGGNWGHPDPERIRQPTNNKTKALPRQRRKASKAKTVEKGIHMGYRLCTSMITWASSPLRAPARLQSPTMPRASPSPITQYVYCTDLTKASLLYFLLFFIYLFNFVFAFFHG